MRINMEKSKEIILSIGMIVKNEEKVLERCLKSLQPLMKAIPSELIIADTGSTDSSVEIAKKYTDNVFHFEWKNDFAAARNSTLDKAKGLWYFFLDADEYLDDDIHEIIEFFGIPELYSEYKTAEIKVRSYTDKNHIGYMDAMLPRFQRIKCCDDNEIIRFFGSIHETIYMRKPLGYFQTILHHTGYVFESPLQQKNKMERNLALMRREYEARPDDLRMISLLLDGCRSYPEESEKYISDFLRLVQTQRNHMFSNVLFYQAISYYKDVNSEYALQLCDEYFKDYPNADMKVGTIAVRLLKASILHELTRFEEAVNEYKKYFSLYKDYKDEKLDLSDCAAHSILGLNESEYITSMYRFIECMIKLRKYKEAYDSVFEIDVSIIQDSDLKEYLNTVGALTVASKNYKNAVEIYKKISELNNKDKDALVLQLMEEIYYTLITRDERMNFSQAFAKSGIQSKYINLMKLISNQNDSEFDNKLTKFINDVENWDNGYLEAIYLSLSHKLDISDVVSRIKSSEFSGKLYSISVYHDDYADIVYEYGVPESYFTDIKKFQWLVTMHEKAAIRCFTLNDEKKSVIYRRYIALLGDYVTNIYNPELLDDEKDIEVLPELHRFGYYMKKANEHLAKSDRVMYIRYMKKALISCEPMNEIVQFLLNKLKKDMV